MFLLILRGSGLLGALGLHGVYTMNKSSWKAFAFSEYPICLFHPLSNMSISHILGDNFSCFQCLRLSEILETFTTL